MTFVQQYSARRYTPGAHLSHRGVLSFNMETQRQCGLKPGMFLTLYYDPQSQQLAFQIHGDDQPQPRGSVKLFRSHLSSAHVSIRAIMNRNGILPGRYLAEFDNASHRIVLTPESDAQ